MTLRIRIFLFAAAVTSIAIFGMSLASARNGNLSSSPNANGEYWAEGISAPALHNQKSRRIARDDGEQIVGHPAGCPRVLFCGCGVSVRVFGHPVRALYLASNYGYYFNLAPFAAGNVAWRHGHAAYIMGGTRSAALLYDPNSGGRQTRIHVRDVSAYHIVDPHSPKRRLAGI